jgi:hypothetical protein
MSRCTGVGHRLQVRWAVGKAKEGEAAGVLTRKVMTDLHCMTRSRVLYNVTQNNSGVKDPQHLSNLGSLGKNRPEPARQP